MSDRGDEIENPVTGEHVTFKKRAAETDGGLLEFELMLEPRAQSAPEHIHARQEEHVEVTSGSVRVRLGGNERQLGPGEHMTLPPGLPHTLWNHAELPAHVIVQVRPAMRTETAIETLFGLARDGKTNRRGNPNPLQGALLAREYDTFLAWPPVAVQRVLLAPLAPIAKLLGYRARYSDYSGGD